jgi:tRNA nucleotidyltransferase/poly(A) polymerase
MRFDLSLIPPFVVTIRDLLAPAPVFLVGGMVRDSVAGALRAGKEMVDRVEGTDWDLTTREQPRRVLSLLRSAGITVATVGIDHGTVAAVQGQQQIEITTFRSDGVYEDGRHCQVRFAETIEEDLERRDFTVNALAVDLSSGEIVDRFDGLADIRANIIRTVGDPNTRFAEDYLRMLRAARLAAKTEAAVDPETLEAIRRHASKITQVSAERIHDELMKMMTYRRPSHGLWILRKTGLLREILPETDSCFEVGQNQYHSDDVGTHLLNTVDAVSPRFPLLRVIALLHDLGKPERKHWMDDKQDYVFYGHQFPSAEKAVLMMRRLRFPTREIDMAESIIENHMVRLGPEASPSSIRRLMRRVGRENIRAFLRLRIADRKANRLKGSNLEPGLYHVIRTIRKIERDLDALKVTDLVIGGQDLIRMGLKPGPIFSEILHVLLDRVLDDPSLNTRQSLLPLASEAARARGYQVQLPSDAQGD